MLSIGTPKHSVFESNQTPYLEAIEFLQGKEQCNSRVSPNFLNLLFVEKGSVHIYINANKQKIAAHDLLILSGETNYDWQSSKNLQGLLLNLGSVFLQEMPPGYFQKDGQPVIYHLDTADTIQSLILSLLNDIKLLSLQEKPFPYATIGSELIRALLTTLVFYREHQPALQNDSTVTAVRIKNYIDAHYLEELSLAILAEKLNINRYYLSHLFKDYTGLSPMQYINKRRLNKAQNLLLTTDLTVTDIAMQCGYNNSNYFQTAFNNAIGMPPGKYRKAWKNI